MPGRMFLHTPGPTNIPKDVLNAMHRPAEDFSAPEFMETMLRMFEELKDLFRTKGEVFAYIANGHGAWEASIVNLLSPGDKVLMPDTGRFSLVWDDMVKAFGISTVRLNNDWRSPIDPQAVEDALRQDTEKKIKAVLAVHVETATGAVSNLEAIREAIDASGHPALFVVDAIASFGCHKLDMDESGIDCVIAASQKGLMMPIGISFTAAGPKALAASEACTSHREYWSWKSRMAMETYRRFCGTAPMHMVWGLMKVMEKVRLEGLDNIIERHARLAEATRTAVARWAEGGALEFNTVDPKSRSNSITCVRQVGQTDMNTIRQVARERFNVSLGGGLHVLADKAFRIGHMGDLNEPMIMGALAGIDLTLKHLKVPHGAGALDAAASFLAETA